MKGYNTVEELSLKESYEILQREESNPYIEQIQMHYEQELEKWHANEKRDFNACKSLHEYEKFIAQYQKYASYYTMLYKKAALDKIETLFWNANSNSIKKCSQYLEKYPRGKYANDARMRIQSIKRKRTITLIIVLIILALICIIAYKPAGELGLSDGTITFSKYGESKEVSITTRASSSNIDASIDASWVHAYVNGKNIQIKADENPYANRYAVVKINTYSTFFGNKMSCVSKNISVRQESGLPTYLSVSSKGMKFDKYGSSKGGTSFVVKTDGIEYSITCPSEYVQMNKKVKNSSKRPCEVEVSVSLNKNKSDYRSTVITVKSDKFTEKVNLYQESGLATYLYVNKTSITGVSKSGTAEGRCYRIEVTTDGMTYSAYTSNTWLHVTQYDKYFEITVDANTGEVRTGNVYVNSNNGHKYTISINQDGNPTSFYLSRSSHTFDTGSDYEYFSISNNSNQSMSCHTYSDSWLHPSIVGGELKVRCDKNDGYPRDGNVYVKCGDKETKISIHQKGWKSCPSCSGGRKQCPRSYNSNHFWNANYSAFCIHDTYYSYDPWTGMPIPQVNINVCPDCHGTGYVECSKCGGKGKIKTN